MNRRHDAATPTGHGIHGNHGTSVGLLDSAGSVARPEVR